MALEITDSNYKEILAEGKPVVIDFWAPWCGPCKMVGPIIEELAEVYEGQVLIGKCDVDENGDVAAEYGIRNIPTCLSTNSPFLKNSTVGMLRIPYSAATSPFSSTSHLPIRTCPSYISANSSMIGATILQGPHQGAQKSTTTGFPSARTSL